MLIILTILRKKDLDMIAFKEIQTQLIAFKVIN